MRAKGTVTMHFGERLVAKSVDRYRTVTAVAAGATLVLALAAGLPSLLPRPLGFLHRVEVDTDPENMLSSDEPVRVYNDAMKKRLALHDLVVVGVVNDADGDGVFNPSSLAKVHALVDFARRLDGGDGSTPLQADSPAARYGFRPGERVIAPDIIAPSTVDNIVPSKGALQFEWLMLKPPADANGQAEIAWTSTDWAPDTVSPVSDGKHVWIIASTGMLICLDLKTGEKLYEHDLGMPCEASPVIVGTSLYITDTAGVTHIVGTGPEFKSLGSGKVGEAVHATPVLVDGRVYLRGDKNLYALGTK